MRLIRIVVLAFALGIAGNAGGEQCDRCNMVASLVRCRFQRPLDGALDIPPSRFIWTA